MVEGQLPAAPWSRLVTWWPSLLMWSLIGLVLASVYGGLAIEDPVLARDDLALIGPLQKVKTVGQYLAAVRAGDVRDVQPVRDLSLGVDIALKRWVGRGVFHFDSVVIFAGIIAIVWRLLRQRYSPTWPLRLLLVLFASHPLMVGSVGWISARKHLLSCAFILAATALAAPDRPTQKEGRGWWAVVLYVLGLLAHPLPLLWPAWRLAVGLWRGGGRRPLLLQTAVASLLGGAIALFNLHYYSSTFISQTHSTKFVEAPGGTGAISLLALGRSFFNCMFPVALATSYAPERIYNVVGLLLMPLLGWAMVKRVGLGTVLVWLGWFLFPLLVVTVRMTNIFVSDTYVLTSSVGLVMIVAAAMPRTAPGRGVATAVLAVAVVLAVVKGRRLAQSWSSDAALWDNAYRTEHTPNVLAKEAFFRANAGDFETALDAAAELLAVAPTHEEAGLVFARAVFMDPGLELQAKLRLLSAHPLDDPWYLYFRAQLLARSGGHARALTDLRRASVHARRFGPESQLVAAFAEQECQRVGAGDCAALVSALGGTPAR